LYIFEGVIVDRLQEILNTMDVPEGRKENWKWLMRNLGINNRTHPDLDEAMNLIVLRELIDKAVR
jgi:hypothetical protein